MAFTTAFLLFAPQVGRSTTTDEPSADVAVWNGFNSSGKEQAVLGFARCYEALAAHKDLLHGRDLAAVVHAIDRTSKSAVGPLPSLILKAVKDAPPDRRVYLQGGETYTNGEWWREMRDGGRETFAQGVLWCETQARGTRFPRREAAVEAIVAALETFYADDLSYSDPRVLAHLDVPYVVALKRSGALKAAEEAKPALRLSHH